MIHQQMSSHLNNEVNYNMSNETNNQTSCETTKYVLEDFSSIISSFEKFNTSMEQDCIVNAILDLSNTVNEIKIFCYNNNYNYKWDNLIATLFQDVDSVISCTLVELQEHFDKLRDNTQNNFLLNLKLFVLAIDQYSRNYNLTIRDLIRANNINYNSL